MQFLDPCFGEKHLGFPFLKVLKAKPALAVGGPQVGLLLELGTQPCLVDCVVFRVSSVLRMQQLRVLTPLARFFEVGVQVGASGRQFDV